jgi:hypothetical protein
MISRTDRARRVNCCRNAVVEPMERRLLLSTSWFVSASAGSDQNPGTLAAPFHTIQKAASLAKPGDTVYIRGGIYRETVTPANSGTSAAPITFTSYNNESVMISGADPITGWSSIGNSKFSATQSWDLGEGNNQLFFDGQMMNEGRWPNPSGNISRPATSTMQSVSATDTSATIHDSALTQPAGFWKNTLIEFGAGQSWFIQTGTVTASGPGWLTFSYTRSTGFGNYDIPTAGNTYFLFDNPALVDTATEWFRDPSTGKVTFIPPAGMNPAAHNITAKHRRFAFEVSGKSYITINGISIFAATIDSNSSSNNLVINHVSASYLTQSMVQWTGHAALSSTGIALNGANSLIENSRINFSAGDGVYLGGSGSRVSNCVINNTDYGGTDAAAIRVYASGCTIDHNTIAYAGQNGIVLRASATTILNNIIHDCGLQTTDCGGIYAIRQDGAGGAIAFNLIYNVVTGGFGGSGIQLDDYSSDYLVYRNVTWNVNDGMKITYVSKGDRIYNNTLDALKFSIQTNNQWDWTGTQVCNNIFTHTAQFGLHATCSNNLAAGTSPMFVNKSADNYQLQSVSPAIDKGMQIGSYTNGYAGAAPDQGAYERGLPPFVAGSSLS